MEEKTYGFINEDGLSYAGKHLLIDVYGFKGVHTPKAIEDMMVEACIATGATVMFQHSHPFDGGGSSGAIILAESHGTWHLWTEERFVAIDVFVCGECDPTRAIATIEAFFRPDRIEAKLEKRGII